MSMVTYAAEWIVKEYLVVKGLHDTVNKMEEESLTKTTQFDKELSLKDKLKLKLFLKLMKSYFVLQKRHFLEESLLETIVKYYNNKQADISESEPKSFCLGLPCSNDESDEGSSSHPTRTQSAEENNPDVFKIEVDTETTYLEGRSKNHLPTHAMISSNTGTVNAENSIYRKIAPKLTLANYLGQHILEANSAMSSEELPVNKKSTNSSKESMKCSVCKAMFFSLKDLRDHQLSHGKEVSHYCYLCPDSFYTVETLTEHYENSHGGKRYNCSHCLQLFDTELCMRYHVKNSHRKLVLCDLCGDHTKDLKTHYLKHSDLRQHQCNICRKSFFSLHVLKTHIKTHSEVREHVCEICGEAFKTIHSLKQHKLIHTDKKPHICLECNRRFRTTGQKKKHVCSFIQTPKPFKCESCPAEYSRLRVLKAHYRIHTGEKPFKCHICGEVFSLVSHLKNHTQKVHTRRVYNCNMCDKTFNWQSSRSYHIRQCHPAC